MVQMRNLLTMIGLQTFLLTQAMHATIAPEYSTQDLTRRADVVVLGIVLAVESRVTPDGKSINTYARVQILDRLKDSTTDSIVTVETLGGTVGPHTVLVPGEARLTEGEKVVLFLKLMNEEERRYRPFGLSQGKFKVVDRGGQAEHAVERDLTGMTLVTKTRYTPPKTLIELEALVRAATENGESKR